MADRACKVCLIFLNIASMRCWKRNGAKTLIFLLSILDRFPGSPGTPGAQWANFFLLGTISVCRPAVADADRHTEFIQKILDAIKYYPFESIDNFTKSRNIPMVSHKIKRPRGQGNSKVPRSPRRLGVLDAPWHRYLHEE